MRQTQTKRRILTKQKMDLFTYLALGDSYTIGEAVLLQNNFPYQTIQLLRYKEMNAAAPEIIAKTGWTTGELLEAIKDYKFLPQYDFVSLLIGVNNQYRGISIEVFKNDLEQLIVQAVALAGDRTERVAILSIPDYSHTPFAQSFNQEKIKKEIGDFNKLNKELAFQYKLHYIEVQGPGIDSNNPDLIAPDGLHPSEKEYGLWSKNLSEVMFNSAKR